MKPITEYEDYRLYLRDFYEERKRTSAFSWREFAKLAGFSSSGYLKLVCDGKTRLSKIGAAKVAPAMGLAGFHADYFCLMVEFCDASDDTVRMNAYSRMRALAKENGVRILGTEAFSYFSSWANPVVRELAPIMRGAKPSDIGKVCVPEISAGEVRNSLELMVRMGLLIRRPDGSYVQTDKGVSGCSAVIPSAVRSMQKQYAYLAADAVDSFALEERRISGLTVGIDEQAYNRIAVELDAFRRKIAAIVSDVQYYDRVYRLNLHLFPLSRPLGEKDA